MLVVVVLLVLLRADSLDACWYCLRRAPVRTVYGQETPTRNHQPAAATGPAASLAMLVAGQTSGIEFLPGRLAALFLAAGDAHTIGRCRRSMAVCPCALLCVLRSPPPTAPRSSVLARRRRRPGRRSLCCVRSRYFRRHCTACTSSATAPHHRTLLRRRARPHPRPRRVGTCALDACLRRTSKALSITIIIIMRRPRYTPASPP